MRAFNGRFQLLRSRSIKIAEIRLLEIRKDSHFSRLPIADPDVRVRAQLGRDQLQRLERRLRRHPGLLGFGAYRRGRA
jgi:hypothetical protein